MSATSARNITNQGRHRSIMLATAAVIAGFAATPAQQAFAQDQTSASAGGGLEEIVVTARRREERLQSVPISIKAFTAADLTAKNVNTAQDLSQFVPSLIINNNAGFGAGYSLRGQGASLGAGPGVVAYFAEVPLVAGQTGSGTYQGGLGDGLFYDMENVQVLNGPQGTLFGRNTTGGAVLFTPQKPTNNFEGYGQVTLGDYNWHEFEGAINIPIVQDKVLLRVSADIAQRDGYTTDVGPFFKGKDYDNRDFWAFRGSLVLRPSDDFENYTIVSSFYKDEHGPGSSIVALNPAGVMVQAFGKAAYADLAAQQARGPRKTSLNSPQLNKEWDYGVIDVAKWDFADNFFLKNIFAYQVNKNSGNLTDYDGTNLVVQDLMAPKGRQFAASSDQYNEELQLNGKFLDDRLTVTVGGYYEYSAPTDKPEFDVGESVQPDPIHLPGVYTPIVVNAISATTQRSQAVYGQATYDFGGVSESLDGLKLTGGYRYTWDHRSDFSTIYIPTFGNICAETGGTLASSGCTLASSGDFHAPTWTAGLDYQLTPDMLLYVKGSRGYKSGGFNLSTPRQSAFSEFKPEFVTDVEVGIKADWNFNGVKARTDIALFSDDYSNIQRSVTQLINGLSAPVTENAATATIQGVEFSGSIIPIAGTEITIDYSFNEGSYDKFVDPLLGNLSGLEFPFLPRNKFSVTGRQTIPVPAEWGDLSVSATYSLQSHVKAGNDYSTSNIIQGYGLLNLRADWKSILGSTFDVGVFVTNVTDELYVTKNFGLFNYFGMEDVEYGEPRMFGAQLRYHFGGESEPEAAPAAYVPPPVVAPAPAPRSYLVFFDFNKSDLTPQATEIVDTAAKNAGPAKVTQLTVTGHTDTVGSDAYNMRLSRRRAESVAAQLEKDGIASSEIEIVAKGKRDLLVPTGDGVREPQNRRVQIVYSEGASS